MERICWECKVIGLLSTTILYSKDGDFDSEKNIGEYRNCHTGCARFEDFDEVEDSKFMIVEEKQDEKFGRDRRISSCRYKKISEKQLKLILPKTYRDLMRDASFGEIYYESANS